MSNFSQTEVDLHRKAISLRDRAEELRTHGEIVRSLEARRILLDLATEADDMAHRIEESLKRLIA